MLPYPIDMRSVSFSMSTASHQWGTQCPKPPFSMKCCLSSPCFGMSAKCEEMVARCTASINCEVLVMLAVTWVILISFSRVGRVMNGSGVSGMQDDFSVSAPASRGRFCCCCLQGLCLARKTVFFLVCCSTYEIFPHGAQSVSICSGATGLFNLVPRTNCSTVKINHFAYLKVRTLNRSSSGNTLSPHIMRQVEDSTPDFT